MELKAEAERRPERLFERPSERLHKYRSEHRRKRIDSAQGSFDADFGRSFDSHSPDRIEQTTMMPINLNMVSKF